MQQALSRRERLSRLTKRPGEHFNWFWRYRLRRWGTTDGRMREPDPRLARPLISTTTRQLLERWLHAIVEEVKLRYDADIDAQREMLQELTVRAGRVGDELAAARRFATQVESRRPDLSQMSDRRHGERDKSETVLRARRLRTYEQSCARARAACERLEAELKRCTEATAAIAVRIDGLERSKVDEAHRLRAAYSHAETIYVRALLRRHPERAILREMLDRSPLPLPAWAARSGGDDHASGHGT